MAFSLDQGLQLDSLRSLEVSVWQRCRPLQLALTAQQLLRRREGVGILGDTAPSQEAFSLSLQLEFGDTQSLATR